MENETKLQGALSRLLRGKTVPVIAHRMRIIRAANHIVVLKDSGVVEEGSPSNLMARLDGIFRHMAELQDPCQLDAIEGAGAYEHHMASGGPYCDCGYRRKK